VIENGKYKSDSKKGPQIGLNTASVAGKNPDGSPLWTGTSTQDVVIDAVGFTHDFVITKDQIQKPKDTAKRRQNPQAKKWPGDE